MPLSEKNQAEVLVGAVLAAARVVVDTFDPVEHLHPALFRLKTALAELDALTAEKLAASRWNEKRRGRR